jgi:hypothetical protein
VVLNLTIDSDATRILGAENHVCELQLVLRRLFLLQAATQPVYLTTVLPVYLTTVWTDDVPTAIEPIVCKVYDLLAIILTMIWTMIWTMTFSTTFSLTIILTILDLLDPFYHLELEFDL